MPTTSKGLRYPASSAAPNVPQDIQNLASDVNGLLLFPATQPQRATWVAQTYAATNNYNLASITISPNVGRPYIAVVHVGGIMACTTGTSGSLRINLSGTGIVAADSLTQYKTSATAVAYRYIATTGSSTFTANLEVLAATIGTFADATHAYIEGFAIPL